MLTLPKGYQHKKNIIVYNNLEELKRYILYYVQHEEERKKIALQGWKLAMNRHRTFHAMEELFFGKALTNTSIYY
jgi:spore maturation protein CgeB